MTNKNVDAKAEDTAVPEETQLIHMPVNARGVALTILATVAAAAAAGPKS